MDQISIMCKDNEKVSSSRKNACGMFLSPMQTLDILHPSTSLEWEEWPSLSVKMSGACSVYLNGTLYVGGGFTDEPGWEDDAALYSFKPGVDTTWTVTDTPTYWYTLVVHDSGDQW